MGEVPVRGLKYVLGSAAVAVAILGGAAIASADHTTLTNGASPPDGSHTTVAGNVRCSVGTHLLKIDPVANGTYTLSNGGQIIISNFDGTSFDWAIAPGSLNLIDANVVLVKGGPNTEKYQYLPFSLSGFPAHDADQGLTPPLNPNNGKYYGVSHISFCFDDKA